MILDPFTSVAMLMLGFIGGVLTAYGLIWCRLDADTEKIMREYEASAKRQAPCPLQRRACVVTMLNRKPAELRGAYCVETFSWSWQGEARQHVYIDLRDSLPEELIKVVGTFKVRAEFFDGSAVEFEGYASVDGNIWKFGHELDGGMA